MKQRLVLTQFLGVYSMVLRPRVLGQNIMAVRVNRRGCCSLIWGMGIREQGGSPGQLSVNASLNCDQLPSAASHLKCSYLPRVDQLFEHSIP